MLLQDEYYAPPVKPDEVFTQATPTVGRSGAPCKGELALLNGSWEAELIDVWEVFHMTDW